PGRRSELVDAKLTRALMMGSKLENCDLTGAELADADLTGADLSGSILVATDLSGATLTDVNLKGAVLSGLHLDERTIAEIVRWGGTPCAPLPFLALQLPQLLAQHKNWIESGGAAGKRLDIDMVDLTGADFSGRDLSGARIQRSNLGGAKFRNANLVMADFAYSGLAKADFGGADLSGCVLRRADLSGASLREAVLRRVALGGDSERPWPTNLQYARLVGADITCAVVEGAIFRYADLTGARTNQTLLDGADLHGTCFAKAADA
ncbi:MAG: pentapeptide repeat-containing protein, partial [Rhodospirillaceae bacterium]